MECQELIMAGCMGRGLSQAVDEQGSVRKVRQFVMVCEVLDLLLGRLAVGDVEHDPIETARFSIVSEHPLAFVIYPADAAVCVDDAVLELEGPSFG